MMTSYAVSVENTLNFSLAPSALASHNLKLNLECRRNSKIKLPSKVLNNVVRHRAVDFLAGLYCVLINQRHTNQAVPRSVGEMKSHTQVVVQNGVAEYRVLHAQNFE